MASRIRALDPAEGKSARPRNDLLAHLTTTNTREYVMEKSFLQGKNVSLRLTFPPPEADASRPVTKPKKPRKPGRRAPSETELLLAEALFAPDPEKVLRGGAA